MTYSEIVSAIAGQLNLTSTEAMTRIGIKVNLRYKRVCSEVGVSVAQRVVGLAASTAEGIATVTVSGVEKIERVVDDHGGSVRVLEEVTLEELRRETPAATDTVTRYAVQAIGPSSVTIRLDVLPQTVFDLRVDGRETAETLSGALEPQFSASFHDILVEGVLADELRKMEKGLSAEHEKNYDKRLSKLKMDLATGRLRIQQGGAAVSASGTSGSGGGSGISGGTSYTQTGLITFDRDPSAPFAVAADSAVVTNLDADMLDGQHGAYYTDADNLDAGTVPDARFPAVLPAASGANLTNLPAANLTGTLPAISGANLTNLNASNLASGTVPLARLSGITNTEISASAAIAWSKLDTTGAAFVSSASFGSTPAATGTIRLSNLGSIIGRNAGNTADLGVGLVHSDNKVYIGEWTNDAGLVLGSSTAIEVTRGITFPAVQVASANANTLDDYEEGTWTPVLGGSGGTSGQTYSSTGFYVKVGRLVYATYVVVLSNKGTITGSVQLQGLPFQVYSGHSDDGAAVSRFANLAINWIALYAIVGASTTVATIRGNTAAALNNITDVLTASIANNTELRGNLTYLASS